jgi:glycosyltransferase involved in cell wall biosynthesis
MVASFPLRVAFFDARYKSFYGAQHSLRTLVTNSDPERILPLVVTTAEGELAGAFREVGAQVRILPLASDANVFGGQVLRYTTLQKTRMLGGVASFTLRALRWLRAERIDVVYANDLRSLLLVGPAARLLGLPVVWYVREDRRLGRVQPLGARLADRILMIADSVRSAFTEEELARHAGKFTTLHTGFDVSRYEAPRERGFALRAQLGLPPRASVVGLVGSITERKGHDLLVGAAPAIVAAHPETRFLLVGDVPAGQEAYRNRVQAEIRALGLERHFAWLGYTPDVAASYAAMDLLVLPSRSEGLPRTLVEALASGLPVVASDVGGVREILTEPVLGDVMPDNTSWHLAQGVCARLARPEACEDRSVRSARIADRFSIPAYVRGFEEIVRSLFDACEHR